MCSALDKDTKGVDELSTPDTPCNDTGAFDVGVCYTFIVLFLLNFLNDWTKLR